MMAERVQSETHGIIYINECTCKRGLGLLVCFVLVIMLLLMLFPSAPVNVFV